MLWGDSREAWNGRTMSDPRVSHFWDGDLQLGNWFAKEVEGWEGTAWDVYYLYGPDATWETIPEPLLGSGETIYAERHKLKKQVSALLGK